MALYRYDDPALTYDAPGFNYDMAAPGSELPHRMKKIKLSLSVLNPLTTATLADAVAASMTDNVNFPTPDPLPTVLSAGATAVLDKITAITESEAATTVLRDELKVLTANLKIDIRKMADHVASKAGGNEMKIHSAGFAVVGDPTPRGPLSQVGNLMVLASDMEGELRVRWGSVPGALNYSIDQASSAEGPWSAHVATSTRTDYTFTGLTPGQKYWFRVRAFGTPGYGPFSDPACRMAA